MKQRLTFYFILTILILPGFACAQQSAKDSVPYKMAVYQVKKKSERIADIAQKLKVDPNLISSLNNYLSLDSVLTKGQKITVPTYAKTKKGAKGRAESLTEPKPERNIEAVSVAPVVDTELIQNRILLTDATLDLNQTLLQGIQASLDSLNVKDKNVIDEKNISLTIHRMQRQRDKAILTPVLLHMQDSLKTEINNEENEKAGYEKILGLNTIVKAAAKPKDAEMAAKNDAPATDTVHIRPVIEASSSIATSAAVPVMHWETAKAIYYADDTLGETENADEQASGTQPQMDGEVVDNAYKPSTNGGGISPGARGSDSARIIKAQYFYTRALKFSTEKNYKGAAEYLKKAIDLYPGYYNAWFELGEAEMHSGLYTKAMGEFIKCSHIDSTHAPLYYKMGVTLVKLKHKTDALKNFNRSLKLDPDYVPALISRAAEYYSLNQYKTAVKEYGKVLKLDPAYHTAYKAKGMAEYQLKNYTEAVDDFTRFLIFNETDGAVYYYRGMARMKQNDSLNACTDLSFSAKLGYQAAIKVLATSCK